MNWKNKIWKYATALVVVLILLNPEMASLALFIDAIGLELFLILLEIQLIAILSVLFNTKIKPVLVYMQRTVNCIINKPEQLIWVTPAPASLMHILVFSTAIGVMFNTF